MNGWESDIQTRGRDAGEQHKGGCQEQEFMSWHSTFLVREGFRQAFHVKDHTCGQFGVPVTVPWFE